MKKLIAFAAFAAMGMGAWAACDKPTTPSTYGAEVYDVAMSIKTTICKCANVKTVVKTVCDKNTTTSCIAWRVIASKKVNGEIWSCSESCDPDIAPLDSTLELTPALWNRSCDNQLTAGNQYFWIDKDKVALDSLMTFKWLARIGKNKTEVEAAGTFGDGIYFAGCGTYDAKNKRVKTIKGNVAGIWGAPLDCSDTSYVPGSGTPSYCPAYQLCNADLYKSDFSMTVMFGTFTVKYNAAKSKKLAQTSVVCGNVVPTKAVSYGIYDASTGVYSPSEEYISTQMP